MCDLANDCFRFVTGFFEVITTSAPHIYHSALLCPKESIVRRLYGPQVKPMAKVILGLTTSWDPTVAAARLPRKICTTAWSPCSRFIAISHYMSSEIVIFGAATLEPFHTVQPPQESIQWNQITFSPGSQLLTGYSHLNDCVISWDVQTGGLLSNIDTKKYLSCHSLSYSGCGTIIGALFKRNIVIYNVFSCTCRTSHSIQQDVHWSIWTLGEYLQFATVESKSITIWQVSFTSGHPPSKIGSLSIPKNFSSNGLILLLTLSWFAFIYGRNIHVWDAQHNKVLLKHQSGSYPRSGGFAFSSDGCFFSCASQKNGSYLWKEGSDGYLPHQKLESSIEEAVLISPNGESVILDGGQMLQLLPAANSPTSISSFSTKDVTPNGSFFIEFVPDESLVAFAQESSHTVIILDITSGNPLLVLDTHVKIYGLRMTRDKIIVVSGTNIHTWNLPARDSIVYASRNINNSFKTTILESSSPINIYYGSISPDLNYLFCKPSFFSNDCQPFNMKTGQKLGNAHSGGGMLGFTESGNEVWSAGSGGGMDKWQIVEGNGSDAIRLNQIWRGEKPQSEFPWHSPSGYQITDEGWILSSSGKQLLWLPHHWWPNKVTQKKWDGKFLAIWNKNSPAPYILELEI